jgi:hypothetical protein
MSTDWKRYSSVLTPSWLRQFISRVPDGSALPWTEYGVPSGVAEGLNSRSEEPPPRRGRRFYSYPTDSEDRSLSWRNEEPPPRVPGTRQGAAK